MWWALVDGLHTEQCLLPSEAGAHSKLSHICLHIQFQQSVIVIKINLNKICSLPEGSQAFLTPHIGLDAEFIKHYGAACVHPVFLQRNITLQLVIQVTRCWYVDLVLTMTTFKLLSVWSKLKSFFFFIPIQNVDLLQILRFLINTCSVLSGLQQPELFQSVSPNLSPRQALPQLPSVYVER